MWDQVKEQITLRFPVSWRPSTMINRCDAIEDSSMLPMHLLSGGTTQCS